MSDSSQRVDLVGRVLMNKLRVERLLGEGGMGAVYEVEHLITRHRRALKVMHPKLSANAETIARFIREAGVAGTLRTPYVVETFDAGQLDDGSPYVLMELLEGRPLSAIFEAHEPITAGRLVGLICQVLEGLAVAHRAGIVHRDVKPDNIYVGTDERGLERVRILDFGISKFTQGQPDYQGTLTTEGAMMGTPYYMSPEQALGIKEIDQRSDLYSVGVMLYEGLARKRPYEGQTLAALVLKIHHGDHPRLGDAVPRLPRGLADAVERALSVEAGKRFASAEEMLAALVPFSDSQFITSLQTLRNAAPQFAETLDATASPKPAAKPAPSTSATSMRPLLLGAAAVVVLVVGVGLWVLSGPGAEPAGADARSDLPPTTSSTIPSTAAGGEPIVPPPVPSGVLPPATPQPPPSSVAVATEPVAEGQVPEAATTPRTGRRPRSETAAEGSTAPADTTMAAETRGVGTMAAETMAAETMTAETMAAETMTTMGEPERFGIDRGVFE